MLLDLPSRQDVEALAAKLDQLLAAALAKPAEPAAEPLLTLDEVAAYTRFDSRTVRDWVQSGRFNTTGHRAYLPAYEFRGGQLRFKRADVEAFGLGIGVLTANPIVGERPEPSKQAPTAAKSKKNRAPVPSEKALKKVAWLYHPFSSHLPCLSTPLPATSLWT